MYKPLEVRTGPPEKLKKCLEDQTSRDFEMESGTGPLDTTYILLHEP